MSERAFVLIVDGEDADGQAIARGQKVTIEAIEGNKTYVLKTD